jgi:hypothetical protein
MKIVEAKGYLLTSEIEQCIQVCEYCGTEKKTWTCCGEGHFKEIYIDIHGNEWDAYKTTVIDDENTEYDKDR